jgi:hypothetical protein
MAVMLQNQGWPSGTLEVEQNASDYMTAAEALEQCELHQSLLRIAKYANKRRSRASLITNRKFAGGLILSLPAIATPLTADVMV